MTDLDKTQLEQIETRLRQRQTLLQDEIEAALRSESRDSLKELAGQVHDSGEESVADMLADLAIATLSNQTTELKEIELALGRLQAGTYGVCVDCGEAMEPERLQAVPTAQRCVDCQDRHEDRQSEKDPTPSL